MKSDIWVTETPKYAAIGESWAYVIDFTNIGTPASINSVKVYDASGTDVTSTVATGSASLSGVYVTTQLITPASAQTYRIIASVTISGNVVYGALDLIAFSIVSQALTNAYCTLAEIKERLQIETNNEDAVLGAVVQGTSRAIDNYCARRFYTTSADETRYYTAYEANKLWIDDDLVSVTTLQTDDDGDGTFETTWTTADWQPYPYNASLEGKPYIAIELTYEGDYAFPQNLKRGVKIVGKFGYSTCPLPVREACIIQAARLFKRKDAIFGVLGSADMGTLQVVPKLDPDVQLLLETYRRIL